MSGGAKRIPVMGELLTRLGVYTASPVAFLVLIVYAVLWYILEPETLEWHAVATLATWAMTLVIQRAEHRDTQAIHAKLDEILHALGDARDEVTRMDDEEPEEIERRRKHMRSPRPGHKSSPGKVNREGLNASFTVPAALWRNAISAVRPWVI